MFLRDRPSRRTSKRIAPPDGAQKTHIFFFDEPLRELHPQLKNFQETVYFFVAFIFIFRIKKIDKLGNFRPATRRALSRAAATFLKSFPV